MDDESRLKQQQREPFSLERRTAPCWRGHWWIAIIGGILLSVAIIFFGPLVFGGEQFLEEGPLLALVALVLTIIVRIFDRYSRMLPYLVGATIGPIVAVASVIVLLIAQNPG